MPDTETQTEVADTPKDFASIATDLVLGKDADAKPDAKSADGKPAEKPAEKPAKSDAKDARGLPDELFAKKPDEKPADTKPVDEALEIDKIPDADFKDPKRKADWDTLKSKGREFEKQARENEKKAADLETKIKEYEAKGKDADALNEKLAKLEKEHGEAMALVRQVNQELDPAWRERFVDGRAKKVKDARQIVEESGGNADAIEGALRLTGKPHAEAMKEITEGMDVYTQNRLARAVEAIRELDDEAASKRSNPEAYLQQRQKEEQVRTAKDHEERVKTANLAFDSAEESAMKELEVLRKVDGLEWWNKQGDDIRQRAKQLWNTNTDPQVAARKFMDAEAMPVYRQLLMDERTERARLQKEHGDMKNELEGLYKKSPSVGGPGTSATTGFKDFATQAHGIMTGNIPIGGDK